MALSGTHKRTISAPSSRTATPRSSRRAATADPTRPRPTTFTVSIRIGSSSGADTGLGRSVAPGGVGQGGEVPQAAGDVSRGTARTIRLVGGFSQVCLGQRLAITAALRTDGTYDARRIRRLGRTTRARFAAVVVKLERRRVIVSAGGSVFAAGRRSGGRALDASGLLQARTGVPVTVRRRGPGVRISRAVPLRDARREDRNIRHGPRLRRAYGYVCGPSGYGPIGFWGWHQREGSLPQARPTVPARLLKSDTRSWSSSASRKSAHRAGAGRPQPGPRHLSRFLAGRGAPPRGGRVPAPPLPP